MSIGSKGTEFGLTEERLYTKDMPILVCMDATIRGPSPQWSYRDQPRDVAPLSKSAQPRGEDKMLVKNKNLRQVPK